MGPRPDSGLGPGGGTRARRGPGPGGGSGLGGDLDPAVGLGPAGTPGGCSGGGGVREVWEISGAIWQLFAMRWIVHLQIYITSSKIRSPEDIATPRCIKQDALYIYIYGYT